MESTNYFEMNAISRDGWIAEMSINNNLLIQNLYSEMEYCLLRNM